MAQSKPFFDPGLAELQRQLAFQQATGTADLSLERNRVLEDANLMRPYMERRFSRAMNDKAASTAGRGFHGSESGIMREELGQLGEDQAFASGTFERNSARDLEDIERAIATLTQQNTLKGAEGVRKGAGRAGERAINTLPF